MSKLKNFCKNLSRKSKAKSAKKRAAKLEKKMNKLADRADKICRNRYDFEILANKIFTLFCILVYLQIPNPYEPLILYMDSVCRNA